MVDGGSDEEEDSEDDWEEVEGNVKSCVPDCLSLLARSHAAILFFCETKTRNTVAVGASFK